MDNKTKMKHIVTILKKRYVFDFHTKGLFRILISTILSQHTNDRNMMRATERLFAVAKTPQQIVALSSNRLQQLIRPSGMYRQKAKKIRATCEALIKNHKGEVPKTRQELLKLYGVGYKTADIVLSYGLGKPRIAIDVHVNRCVKRIGLAPKKAGYEETRKSLENLTPLSQRKYVNTGLVQFGREICKKQKPRCAECLIEKMCEYDEKNFG
jgi:endonuclease-3